MSNDELSCTVCHRPNAAWRQHCGTCGCTLQPRAGACSCGVHNEPEDRFCGACARPVRASGARSLPPRPHRSLGIVTGTTTKLDVLDDVLISEAPARDPRRDVTTKLDVLDEVMVFEETPVGRAHGKVGR